MADMNAVVVRNGPRRLSLESVEMPTLERDEVLVKVKSNGLCGSDVHGFLDENSKGRVEGLIMGHEAAGIIAEVGADVKDKNVGERVVVNPQFRCNSCYACAHGWYNVCEKAKIIGSALRGFVQGAMADYVKVPSSHLHTLPDNLSFDEGSMVEPVANAIHVINRTGISLGDRVAVMGAGTIGLCMVRMAKLAGAGKVIAIDIEEHHLELAKKFGADHVVNSKTCDPVEAVRELCDGIGTDVTLEAVGIGKTYSQAALMTRKRGTLAFFGAAKPTAEMELYPLLHRELNMVGCTGFDRECDIAIEMMARGDIDVKPLISHRFDMADSARAIEVFQDPSQQVIKAVLVNEE